MNIFNAFDCKRANSRLVWLLFYFMPFGSLPASAQIMFQVFDLPAIPGEYSRAYVSSNANPSALIGPPGGPQPWDFSQAPQPMDIVRRLDIVPPTDGGNQSSFPNASYAERYTDEVGGAQERDFYSIDTNAGRLYFGYYDSLGLEIFSSPVVDIPTPLGFGTNWTCTLTQTNGFVSVQDVVSASVDAYGTVILPQIGQVQALRVNQLTTQQEIVGSLPLGPVTYFREYFWLVSGIGKAIHIISTTGSTPPPANFTSVYEFRRVFESSSITNAPAPLVSNLRLQLQNGLAVLNWSAATNASTYQVQSTGDLTSTNWQVLASPPTNSWSESVSAARRFYRVFLEP